MFNKWSLIFGALLLEIVIIAWTVTFIYSRETSLVTTKEYSHCSEVCGEMLEGVYSDGNCLCDSKDTKNK